MGTYWVPMMRGLGLVFFAFCLVLATLLQVTTSHGEQPLLRIVVQNTQLHLSENAYVKASPSILGLKVGFCSTGSFIQLPYMSEASFFLLQVGSFLCTYFGDWYGFGFWIEWCDDRGLTLWRKQFVMRLKISFTAVGAKFWVGDIGVCFSKPINWWLDRSVFSCWFQVWGFFASWNWPGFLIFAIFKIWDAFIDILVSVWMNSTHHVPIWQCLLFINFQCLHLHPWWWLEVSSSIFVHCTY